MADLQLKDNYTQVPNDILEALPLANLRGGEYRVVLVVLRKTCGWHKEEDRISISQLQELTGLSRRGTILSLQNLEAKRILIVKRNRGRGHKNEINSVGINKNSDQWVVQEKSPQYQKDLDRRNLAHRKSKQGLVQENMDSIGNCQYMVKEIETDQHFPAPTKEDKRNAKESQNGTSSIEERQHRNSLYGQGEATAEKADRFRRNIPSEFDCCLLDQTKQYDLTQDEAPRVIGPYCERRKFLGWCFDKQTCHDSVLQVIQKVKKYSPKSYANYLEKSLQEYLIDNADNMKNPRSKGKHVAAPMSINDILQNILKQNSINLNDES